MKLQITNIPLNDLISRNKVLTIVVNPIFNLIFFIVRFFCRLFSILEGNVVVIFLHKLGDTIFTIPAIREIQNHYGKKVNIMCFAESIPIYSLVFTDLKFCAINRNDFYFGGRIMNKKAKNKLKNLKPSTIIDLTGSMATASLILNSTAKKIIGTNGKSFKKIYDHFIERRKNPHLSDMYLDIIAQTINLSKHKSLIRSSSSTYSNGEILIHPFAGWREKEWNLEKYIRLAKKLNEYYPVSILIKGDEVSIDIIEEIKFAGIKVLKSLSIDELIKVIENCSFFIGNDSGPLNIANFLGKPTITIFGATNPIYTITGLGRQKYVQRKLNCSSKNNEQYCLVGGAVYDCSGTQCMNLLSVEDVYKEMVTLINSYVN